jgi:hypothetical protein
MKVKLGPYQSWIGPYQIAEKIFFWVDKYEESSWATRCNKFGEWLSNTWVANACEWIHSKRKRQEYVRIDYYDSWNVDHTLAVIIAPLLKSLKANKHGFGFIDDVDVPEHLRSTNGTKSDDWSWDSNAEARYEWFLDELIWAFSQHKRDDEKSEFYDHTESNKCEDLMESIKLLKVDDVGLKAHEERKQHAFTMFGKYFQTLWD